MCCKYDAPMGVGFGDGHGGPTHRGRFASARRGKRKERVGALISKIRERGGCGRTICLKKVGYLLEG